MSRQSPLDAYHFQPSDLTGKLDVSSSTIVYEKLISTLFTMLIASIPFFSVRNPTLVLSPPLLILLVIVGVVGLKSLITLRMPISISLLDIGLSCYFSIIVLNVTLLPNADGAKLALAKTGAYIGVYLFLKIMLRDISVEQIGIAARNGVLIGTCSFFVIALSCLVITGKLQLLLQGFDYYSVTRNTFLAIDTILGSGQPDDFEGRDIMRNAVAEAFTFYFLCTIVFRFEHPITNIFLLAMNLIFVICTFSRRAFYAIAIVVFGGSIRDSKSIKRAIYLAFLIGSIVASALLLEENASDSRLADFSDGGRFQQYYDAIEQFDSAPIFGIGFGAKLERGSYVHNFVLGSAAMMGIVGMLAALFIYSSTIMLFLNGLFRPRVFNTAVFLIIPILSMSIGGTFEGLFTVTGWIAIAMFSVCEEKQQATSDEFGQQQAFAKPGVE